MKIEYHSHNTNEQITIALKSYKSIIKDLAII